MIHARGSPIVAYAYVYAEPAAGGVASRLELLREVWGYSSEVVSRTVDTHVAEVRRKLEDNPTEPKYLLTVRKAGYRLRMDA